MDITSFVMGLQPGKARAPVEDLSEELDEQESLIASLKEKLEAGASDEFPADRYFEGGYAEVNLPNATKIRPYGFYQYTDLVNISVPNATSIGDYAFQNCTNLANISMPKVTSIGNAAFISRANLALTELPSGLKSIGFSAFESAKKIALTELPSGLTSIGRSAFINCWRIALTSLPSGLTAISDYTFKECRKNAITTIPSGVKTIGAQAFYNNGLTMLTFLGKPNSISSNAFQNCTNLTMINVPWAEGEVANAPWGATNASINYNMMGG